MRIRRATIYAIDLPFVAGFEHSTADRASCDSIIVRLESRDGAIGWGEGAPRPYVTGETVDQAVATLERDLWPALCDREWPEDDLAALMAMLPDPPGPPTIVAHHASRAAAELALIDCGLRTRGDPAGKLLPPARQAVRYSGVISAGEVEQCERQARRLRLAGLRQIKIKVGRGDDVARVRAVSAVLGRDVELRVDANGVWSAGEAVRALSPLAELGVVSVEEPLGRDRRADLARLRADCPIPIAVDESLVTEDDAARLIDERACDLFNLRVSKCGGLGRSIVMARMAASAGIGVQVGCHVGETAILSAAGRHLAAAIPDLRCAEGSYGRHLLSEDISDESIAFGHGGDAPVLRAPGLGIAVSESRVRKWARRIVELEAP